MSDDAIRVAVGLVAREAGILTAPEAAATVAAVPGLLERGAIERDERVVLLLTGSGFKYMDVRAS